MKLRTIIIFALLFFLPSQIFAASSTRYNVNDFGAIGSDLVDDTNAIQAAIDRANLEGGGTVYFPRGNYYIGTYISMKSNIAIEGDGSNSVIHVKGDSDGFKFTGSPTSKIVNTAIRNIKIRGTGEKISGSYSTLIAIWSWTENSIIENTWLDNSIYDAIFILSTSSNIKILNNHITNINDDGINPGGHDKGVNNGTKDIFIRGNYIENVTHDGIHISINTSSISVIGNIIVNAGRGIGILRSKNSLIQGNTIRNSGTGVAVTHGISSSIKIIGNRIDGTTTGHGIIVRNGSEFIEISNNSVSRTNKLKYCIVVYGDSHSITGNDVSECKIGISVYSDNTVINNNILRNTWAGIYSRGKNNLITGNSVLNSATNGILVGTDGNHSADSVINNNVIKTAAADGIFLNSSDNVVFNNTILNAKNYSIYDGGRRNNVANNNIDGKLGVSEIESGNTTTMGKQ